LINIHDLALLRVNFDDEIIIQVNTSDPNGILRVILYWNTTSKVNSIECVWNVDKQLYEGKIPSQTGGTVTYRISAVDSWNNSLSSSHYTFSIISKALSSSVTTHPSIPPLTTTSNATVGFIFPSTLVSIYLLRNKRIKKIRVFS